MVESWSKRLRDQHDIRVDVELIHDFLSKDSVLGERSNA